MKKALKIIAVLAIIAVVLYVLSNLVFDAIFDLTNDGEIVPRSHVHDFIKEFQETAENSINNGDVNAYNDIMRRMESALQKTDLTEAERIIMECDYYFFKLKGKLNSTEGRVIINNTPGLKDQINGSVDNYNAYMDDWDKNYDAKKEAMGLSTDEVIKLQQKFMQEYTNQNKEFLKYFESVPDVVTSFANN